MARHPQISTESVRTGRVLAPTQPAAQSAEYAPPARAKGDHSAATFEFFPIERVAEEPARQRADLRNSITDC